MSKSLHTKDFNTAVQHLNAILLGHDPNKSGESISRPIEKIVAKLLTQAKTNAAARDISIDITHKDLMDLWVSQNGRCAITEIPFDMCKTEKFKRLPWAASLDRIDSSLGYSIGNIRLVCMSVNFAMGEWGEAVFWRMCREASHKFT